MKKQILLSLFVFFAFQALAQSDSCYTDSTINKTFAQMADSVFKHVDLSEVPTGYLIEKAFSTIDNIAEFNGSINDSNVANTLLWLRAYGTLHRAAIDTAIAHDTTSLFNLADTMQNYLDSGYIPIAILNMQYNSIKSTAFENELLHMDGIELYDVEEREESPYEEKTCFIASAGTLRTDSITVNFILPQHLYITNDTRDVDHIEINFNDGEGWRTVAFGSVIPVEFPAAEMYKVIMKVVFENMEERISHFYIEVRDKVYKFGPSPEDYDEHYFIEADEDYEGVTGSAHVFIHYGCSNTDKKLRRPFIVAGGFGDPMTIGNNFLNDSVIKGRNFFNHVEENSNGTYYNIISQEYDLVYVNFFKPTDYIQSNALVLEKIIKLVNEVKVTNGSISQNIVFGNSMGGLVARYALGDMHAKHIANPSTNPDHDTRIYFSHDSPHRGVNAPMGMQAMIKTYYRYFIEENRVPVSEVPSIYWDYQTLMCTSARQMVIDHISPSALHDDFYTELKTVAPFTYSSGSAGSNFGCKAVLISNGSGDGVLQNNGTVDLHPGNIMLQYGHVTGNIFQAFNMYAEPDPASALTSDLVFEAALISMINGQIIYPFYAKAKALTTQYHGLDGMPGSAGPAGALLGQYSIAAMYNHLYVSFPTQCFIPTFSSVAMKDDKDFDYPINSNRGDIEADRFITQDDVSSPPAERNGTHTFFTGHSAQVFADEMLEMAPATIAVNNTYNYGAPISDWIGTTIVNGTLAINKDYTVGPGYVYLYEFNPPMPDNTVYRVETLRHNQCTPTTVTITVNGNLELGDANTSRSGELIIHSGSKVILEDDSYLKIYNNSKLIIEEGAELKIVGTPTILLKDANSIIEIHGKLTLDANAQLNITNTSNGHIVFKCPTGSYCNTDIGSNAQINITGATRNDKVIEITGKGLDFGSNLSVFSVEKGTIELGNNSAILVENDLSLDQVKVTKTSANTTTHKGITINSAQGKNITIVDCYFEYADKGLTKSSTSTLDLLTIETTAFANCSTGLYTVGDACNLDHVYFSTCQTGWQAEDMTATSDFKGYSGSNGAFAIDYEGSSTAHLYVYESRFLSNAQAMRVSGGNKLVVRCSSFSNNETDIQKDYGDLLLDNSVGVTPSSGSGTVYGGDNTFYNTTDYSISLNTAGNIYVQGHNQFVYTTEPTHIFYGTLGSSPTLDNNYWSIYDGSTTQTNFYAGMWSVTNGGNPVLYAYNSANNWNASGACTDAWNGEIVIEGMARDNTSTGTKEITSTKNIFVIYPNPTDKLLHVQCTTPNTNYTIKAIDMTGRIIYLQPTTSNSQTQSFDVSNLAAGLYQILIDQNGVTLAKQKVVVRR